MPRSVLVTGPGGGMSRQRRQTPVAQGFGTPVIVAAGHQDADKAVTGHVGNARVRHIDLQWQAPGFHPSRP
ncbi:MAG: hypothetical protein WDN06_07980 [Asticcacaulis sp.]